MKEYHSIFNHTLAPITPGPSSSNTCGPARIALFAYYMFGEIPKKAIIEYSKHGSFPKTMFGMKSDYAFINGLLGKDQNAPDFLRCYENAKEANMEVFFKEVDDLTIGGYETARLRLFGEDGNNMVIVGESLGGGSFLMHSVDDIPIESSGAYYELFVKLSGENNSTVDIVENIIREEIISDLSRTHPTGTNNSINVICDKTLTKGNGNSLLHIKMTVAPEEQILKTIQNLPSVLWARLIVPVVPEVINPWIKPAFETSSGLIEYCAKTGKTPSQAAVDYEVTVSGWTESQIYSYVEDLLNIMRKGIETGTKEAFDFPGILTQKGPEVFRTLQEISSPSLGFLDKAIPAALGIMEYSNASGKIVCVPTGGSSGVVPGVLLTAAQAMKKTEKELADALLVSGLIGVLMMIEGNNFSGGMTGCQAEIGCATAMAAAGLAALMGGNAKQVCDAACMGLQSFFGLVCDPVCGFVQVPCLARNMVAVSAAATCAKTVLAGFDVLIPLDEMIRAFIDGGRKIMNCIGIGKGGCCATPTAKHIKNNRHNSTGHGTPSSDGDPLENATN